jgi:hypothetical protein
MSLSTNRLLLQSCGDYVAYNHKSIYNKDKKTFNMNDDGTFIEFVNGGSNGSMTTFNEVTKEKERILLKRRSKNRPMTTCFTVDA